MFLQSAALDSEILSIFSRINGFSSQLYLICAREIGQMFSPRCTNTDSRNGPENASAAILVNHECHSSEIVKNERQRENADSSHRDKKPYDFSETLNIVIPQCPWAMKRCQ
jgi:hypothetical protein